MNGEVTQILAALHEGDDSASEKLYELIYRELRNIAGRKMADEQPGLTLQPTALVHEAYLRLVDGAPSQGWQNRRHFFAAAAETMRRILVEYARRRLRLKRGGHLNRTELESAELSTPPPSQDVLLLDEALTHLTIEDPDKAELVKLRYFAGLTMEDTAALLGISRATASRYWAYAKSWLFDWIEKRDERRNRSK